MNLRFGLLGGFTVLCLMGAGAACSSNTVTPPPSPPPGCAPPSCVLLTSTLKHVALVPLSSLDAAAIVAGRGYVSLSDSADARDLTKPVLHLTVTAIRGAAVLTRVPGFELHFTHVPAGTLRRAVIATGAWHTVGNPGEVRGNDVHFDALPLRPSVRLDDGVPFDVAVYLGGVVPPTPTPSPSPTPGAMQVTATCNQSADACASGTTKRPGSVQFTAVDDTADLVPTESGPATTFTLQSDTCNQTDDPSAGGNWASFAPGAGRTAKKFVVTALNAGANGNPASCAAVLTDTNGQSVTIDVEVTLGSVGINER